MAKKSDTFIIDREKLNALNAEGCPACGKKFSLGDTAVVACGAWGDQKISSMKTRRCSTGIPGDTWKEDVFTRDAALYRIRRSRKPAVGLP